MRKKIDSILLLLQIVIIIIFGVLSWRLYQDFREISAAGNVLARLADVGIDTQALVKREQSKDPEDRKRVETLRREINEIFTGLTAPEQSSPGKFQNYPAYQQMLSRLYMQWRKIEVMIDVCRNSKLNEQDLFMLSISFHHQTKRALKVAEKYMEQVENRVQTAKMHEFILLLLLTLTAIARSFTRCTLAVTKSELPK